ncbi:MAG: hypothetical protein NVS9B14_19250 [Candidatus Acidiferrum sp.]
MRFPFRLTAALYKAKVLGLMSGGSASSAIAHVSPGSLDKAKSGVVKAPVVWLDGAEPLLHPEIGRIVAQHTEANRFVFLPTNGYQLRQRIHAVQPSPRLFLTVEFAGREKAHNLVAGRADAFDRSMEGIRAAKLSGFLVAAHFTVTPQTDSCELGELIEFLDKNDVDGFMATSRGQAARPRSVSLIETLDDVRTMIRSSQWERFSALLEESFASNEAVRAGSEGAFEEGD